ncbi:tripartite tricarboxylate transporter TctB family protein [Paracoccus seriniphilus]|uniref:tripartite tricarboxylate transporter TctB family protein n=1 Tax=Paracoccus seriniphilus TaxID=184748 RepID=UPI00356B0023
MTPENWRITGDMALAVVCLIGALLLFIGAADLPPPRFEPLGSAAMPRILGSGLALCALIIAAKALLSLRHRPAEAPAMEKPASDTRRSRSVLTFVSLVLYVAALDLLRMPFWIASSAFLGAIGLILTGLNLRAGLFYALLGAGLGAVLAWVFQNFLYIAIG